MTIINPNKNKRLTFFFASLFAVILFGGIVYIKQYNALANSRYELRALKQEMVSLEVKNADLKNELYQITDASKFDALAEEYGLVLERQPQYITLSQ